MSHTIIEGCNHSHVVQDRILAYSPFLVPKKSWFRRRFWPLVLTTQHFCKKCKEPLRHLDTRYYA